MSLRRTARIELVAIITLLREPWLWLLVALMLAGGAGAYRVPYSVRLDIGGGPAGPLYDTPYLLGGFNSDPEGDSATDPPGKFRWVFDDARIAFPGLGRGVYAATLRVVTAHPGPASPAPSQWLLDGTPLNVVPILPASRSYHLVLPSTGPDLDLRMLTPPFQAPGDPRPLAFAADSIQVILLTQPAPAWPVLGWLAGSVAVLYVLLRRAGLRPLLTGLAGLGFVAGLVWWLAFQRLSLTSFAPRLCAVLLAGLAVSLLVRPLLASLATALGLAIPQSEVRMLSVLVTLAWVIRLGGLLHPQARTSDLGLHMHNLENLIAGEVIFTEDLPGEAGGGPAPYPPAQYVMLAPWHLLANSEQVTRIGNTLADSLVIAALWLVLRMAGAPATAALFAGGLYLFATPLLNAMLVGEMANVWGQALVGPLALLLVRWQQSHAGRRPDLALGIGVTIGLLGHFGVFLSLLIFLGVYAVLQFPRGPWLRFAVIVAVALLATLVLYYSSFVTILAERGGVRVPFGWRRLRGALVTSFGLAGMLGPLLGLLGLAGLARLLRAMRAHVAAGVVLGPLLAAWFCSTLISLGSLLFTQQALRWEAFLFPALAITGGTALAGLHRQGRLGRSAAYTLLAVSCLRGAALWYLQIASYQH